MKSLASPMFVFALTMLFSIASEASMALLKRVAVNQQSTATELSLQLSESVQYTYFTLDNPSRMVVDLKKTSNRVEQSAVVLAGSSVKKVRFGEREKGALRIVFDLNEPMLTDNAELVSSGQLYQVKFQLKPLAVAMGGEVVLAKAHSALVKREPVRGDRPVVVKRKPSEMRSVVVVIDAGHGGKDPGAIGPRGVKEKDVVLQIAKKLARAVDRKKGYKAVLIRDNDTYIPLAQRREIARRTQDADIFVSIHADSWKRRSAKGASVYALSRKGASSALAKHLASHEKLTKSEITGDKRILKTVLADLAMEGSLEHSFRVGDHVLDELSSMTKLHKPKVEKAAFAVLKSPDLPSILIETGFISNPQEEKRLSDSRYQDKLVSAIANGLDRYFLDQPPPGTWLAYSKEYTNNSHSIASGETLSGIAQQYNVSQEHLKRVNNIKSDVIRIGQVLNIPNS